MVLMLLLVSLAGRVGFHSVSGEIMGDSERTVVSTDVTGAFRIFSGSSGL